MNPEAGEDSLDGLLANRGVVAELNRNEPGEHRDNIGFRFALAQAYADQSA